MDRGKCLDLSSILDQAFLDESKKRNENLQSNALIQMKTQLLPTKKPRAQLSTNVFDPVRRIFFAVVFAALFLTF